MAITSGQYNKEFTVDPINHKFALPNHNGSTQGLVLGSTLVTATAAELNAIHSSGAVAADYVTLHTISNVMTSATVVLAPSVTTDGMKITITAKNSAGATIAAVHQLSVYLSRVSTGTLLTTTSASGALTATTGEIRLVKTAKKEVVVNTDANGVAELLLVDSANTAGEYACVVIPATGRVVVSAISTSASYEGG
jgi:hypothetical protein